jgi:hypothetical protein
VEVEKIEEDKRTMSIITEQNLMLRSQSKDLRWGVGGREGKTGENLRVNLNHAQLQATYMYVCCISLTSKFSHAIGCHACNDNCDVQMCGLPHSGPLSIPAVCLTIIMQSKKRRKEPEYK